MCVSNNIPSSTTLTLQKPKKNRNKYKVISLLTTGFFKYSKVKRIYKTPPTFDQFFNPFVMICLVTCVFEYRMECLSGETVLCSGL